MEINQDGKVHPDLLEPWKVIRHFRDLNNLADLLDYDVEVSRFRKRLKEVGYSDDRISQFQQYGARGTRFEWLIPHAIPESGDRVEYHKSKFRHK